MENIAGEKEVKEQLKFENLFPEEKKTPELIPIRGDGLQPRKLEDILPDFNLKKDTYIIYPDGGYHPFYGLLNTLPRYQQKIWPCVRRIKFDEKWKTEKTRDSGRSSSLRENQTIEQVNPSWNDKYYVVGLKLNDRFLSNYYTEIKKNGKHKMVWKYKTIVKLLHRLVGLAFIPNPKNYKLVLHRNDDSTNYLIENLKWGTYGHNMKGKISKRPDTMEEKYRNLVVKGIIKG